MFQLLRYRGIYIPQHPQHSLEQKKEEVQEEEEEKEKEEEKENKPALEETELTSFGFFDLSFQAKAIRDLEKMIDIDNCSDDDDDDDDNIPSLFSEEY